MPTDQKTLTYLRIADEKVRKGAYAEALQAVKRAQACDPRNPYARAYAERIEDLLHQAGTEPFSAKFANEVACDEEVQEPAGHEILAILDAVNTFIQRAEYEEALREIRRARHLDPSDHEFQILEEEIRTAFERQLEEEFSHNERESVQVFLASLIEGACEHAARGEFEESFRNITQGALLNPEDEKLRECASLVTIAKNQWNARAGQQQAASECLANILESCKKRDTVRHHAYAARTHILDGAYDDALLEIALALTIDPTHAELRGLEQEAWQGKTSAAARSEATRLCDGTVRLSRLYLLAAEEFAHEGDFVEALELITKMRALDPSNPDARKAEIRIRQLEMRRQQKPSEVLHLLHQQTHVEND